MRLWGCYAEPIHFHPVQQLALLAVRLDIEGSSIHLLPPNFTSDVKWKFEIVIFRLF